MPEQEIPAAQPGEPIWKRIWVTIFWAVVMASGLWLAIGGMPPWLERGVVAVLWINVIVLVWGGAVALLIPDQDRVRREPSEHYLGRWKSPSLGRRVHWLARVLIILVLVGALVAAGRPVLAALYALVPFFGIAQLVDLAHRMYGLEKADVGAGRWAVYRFVRLAVRAAFRPFFWTLKRAAEPIGRLCEHVSRRRIGTRLREAFEQPEGFVYFLYSEPHEREHFLGPDGVLASLDERMVARDWRADIKTALDTSAFPDFMETPEGRLLERFEVSNLRDHLPFVAVVGASGGPRPFRLNEAYRTRHRDGGRALREIEGELRVALAKAFPTPRPSADPG